MVINSLGESYVVIIEKLCSATDFSAGCSFLPVLAFATRKLNDLRDSVNRIKLESHQDYLQIITDKDERELAFVRLSLICQTS